MVREDDDKREVHPDLRINGRMPLYEQVANLLEDRIRAGELGVDDRLIAERELAEYFGVSYSTVRRAMEELRDRGTVSTVHGKGTYVVRVPRRRE